MDVKPKAFLVVGHSNWGKSLTLIALTNNDWRVRRFIIGKHEFYIKRMSNDDSPRSLCTFVDRVDPDEKPYILATLCPSFIGISKSADNPAKRTEEILKTLSKKYDIYAFVLTERWKSCECISTAEINKLATCCKKIVEVASKNLEAKGRAKRLKEFILENL